MKRQNHRTQDYWALTLTLLSSLIFSVAAFGSEKFVLSATNGPNLILRTFKLDQNQIKTIDANVIDMAWPSPSGVHYGIYNTAVAFRNDNNALIFDVYYGVCQDIDCGLATVSMKRLDLNLRPKFAKDFSIPVEYALSTVRLQKRSGVSLRLLLANRGKIEERRLDKNGAPRTAKDIAFPKGIHRLTASEDGKMLGAINREFIQIRSLHPEGPVTGMKMEDVVTALTLSGPVARNSQLAASRAESYRFLFFREYRDFPDTVGFANLQSRIMKQRINDSTGEFLGIPKTFTKFKLVPYYSFGQSVSVTPDSNVVFFTEFDTACKRDQLWGQVFNPQKRTKVGPPQLLIECSELPHNFSGIDGIDVAQFEP